MRIAVTGGSGAIGTFVCDELARAGHDAVSLDRLPPRVARPFSEVDLRRLDSTRQALQGYDAIVHLAAIPDPYNDPPEDVIGHNTVISYNVFEAARLNGVRRVVYGCSDSSTGFGIHNTALTPLYVPIDEAHPLWPHEAYSLSKHFGERMAETYAKAYGIETLSLRYNWVWVKRWETRAAEIVAKARAGEFNPKGAWLGGYISVRDVARACLTAVQYRFPSGQPVPYEAFFFTAPNTFYPIPTLDLLRTVFGEALPVKDAAYFAADPFASAFDLRKAKRLLGWEPKDAWQTFDRWER